MTKKILVLTTLYFGLGLIFSLNQSCRYWKYDLWISDVVFYGKGSNYFEEDLENITDLTEEIGFRIFTSGTVENASNNFKNRFEFFTASYAFTKCVNWQNNLNIETYSLKFDRSFILADDTIPPYTNILCIENILNRITINLDQDCKTTESTIDFSENLRNQLEFEEGEYLVMFSCLTTDNIAVEKQIMAIFKE